MNWLADTFGPVYASNTTFNTIIISSPVPTLTFEDTTTGDDDWLIFAESDNLYFQHMATVNLTFYGTGSIGLATSLIVSGNLYLNLTSGPVCVSSNTLIQRKIDLADITNDVTGNIGSDRVSGNIPSTQVSGNIPVSQVSGNWDLSLVTGTLASSFVTGSFPSSQVTGNFDVSRVSGNWPLANVSGVLAIVNGGTNSSVTLSNSYVMVSTGDSIVEDKNVTTNTLDNLNSQFSGYFGDGSDGDLDVTFLLPVTLTRDSFYEQVDIATGAILTMGQCRLFVSKKLTNQGTITARGRDGTSGSIGTAGTGGPAATTVTDPAVGPNGAGANGGAGTTTAGVRGTTASTLSVGGGGMGGNGSTASSGTGGGGGQRGEGATFRSYRPQHYFTNTFTNGASLVGGGTGGGGGGGGGGSGLSTGGGGGGGGAGGGVTFISAATLDNSSGIIDVSGGNGGNGGPGGGLGAGTGGGGGGGGGGTAHLNYKILGGLGSIELGVILTNGGTPGTGGLGLAVTGQTGFYLAYDVYKGSFK